MDILNWLYLVKSNLVKTAIQDKTKDLVILGNNVSFDKRGDKFQSYGITVSDFASQLSANLLPIVPVSNTVFTTFTGTLAQTVVKTLTLPANTLQIGNYWELGNKQFGIFERAVNYAGTGATTIHVYMNNVPNLSGSPIQLSGGLSASGSTNYGQTGFGVTPTSGSPTNTIGRITSNTNVQYTADIPLPGGYTTATIFNITQPIYIMVAVTLNDVGTTVSIGPVLINPLQKL